MTLVYQIDHGRKRLLWIGKDRTTKTFLRFFRMLGKERSGRLKFVCSDMWQPYLKVIAKKAASAIHVLDRFHIVQKMNKAIDEVRAGEAKQMKADGYEPVLKHSRWTAAAPAWLECCRPIQAMPLSAAISIASSIA